MAEQDVPGSSFTFPVWALGSAVSPNIPDSFSGEWCLETKT